MNNRIHTAAADGHKTGAHVCFLFISCLVGKVCLNREFPPFVMSQTDYRGSVDAEFAGHAPLSGTE